MPTSRYKPGFDECIDELAVCVPGPTNATPSEKIDTASLLDIELLGAKSLRWVDFGSSARWEPSSGHCYASHGGDRQGDGRGTERAQLHSEPYCADLTEGGLETIANENQILTRQSVRLKSSVGFTFPQITVVPSVVARHHSETRLSLPAGSEPHGCLFRSHRPQINFRRNYFGITEERLGDVQRRTAILEPSAYSRFNNRWAGLSSHERGNVGQCISSELLICNSR